MGAVCWRTLSTKWEKTLVSDELIWEVWLSKYWLPCVRAADKVGLFQQLKKGSAKAADLASVLKLDERVTGAVLQLLKSLKLLTEEQGAFSLSAQSDAFLTTDSPAYWGPALNLGPPSHTEEFICKALKEGTESTNGAPDDQGIPHPGKSQFPVNLWAKGEVSPERAEGIGKVMESHSLAAAAGFAKLLPTGMERRVLDVGGGSGCFSIALCQAHPKLRCTVLELQGMCPVVEQYVERAGLADRIDTVACNMFAEEWPGHCDAILFSNVLHDWRVESCRVLLNRGFQALPAGGEVWIHEMLLDGDSPVAAAFSLMMALGTQGQQFHFSELKALLIETGFENVEMQPAASRYSLVRARKP